MERKYLVLLMDIERIDRYSMYKKIFLFLVVLISIFSLTSCKKNIKKTYKDFGNISEEFCKIPGLDTKFVPQGMSYNEQHDLIFIVGWWYS